MSVSTLILGEPGSGKSTSMRKLDPKKVLLIQSISKPLPFRSKEWKPLTTDPNSDGCVYQCSNPATVAAIIQRSKKKIIIIDDWNLLMSVGFFARAMETGYSKFSELALAAYNLFQTAMNLPSDTRVYFMGHVEKDNQGHIKAMTIGKMLDQHMPVESMFTIVMRAVKVNGKNYFSTQNSGDDTVKTPIDLFSDELIDNDLSIVDAAICDYYSIQSGE